MTTIKLHNTRTRTKEDFVPIDSDNVRMYVCGPTVYDRAHLGNARPVVVFDVLYRLLRHVYGADQVTYVRNFTDVDDKINATALARKQAGAEGSLEQLVQERSDETIGWYLHDMGALGALEPNAMPRATEYIAQMIEMIEGLIAKGHAYAAEGHVLFAVDSWKSGYGKLSGRSVEAHHELRLLRRCREQHLIAHDRGGCVSSAGDSYFPEDILGWAPLGGRELGN